MRLGSTTPTRSTAWSFLRPPRPRHYRFTLSHLIQLVLDAYEHESPRTYALLAIRYETGGRIGTAFGVRIENLDQDGDGHRTVG